MTTESVNCVSHISDSDCNTAALHIEHLNFSYTHGMPVLIDISLCLHQGVFLGVIGPNGGGKSTLIKLVLGLLKPDSGMVKVFGQNIKHSQSWRSDIGYVPQGNEFDSSFPVTALDVVMMASNINKAFDLRKRAIKKTAMEKLDVCGVADLAYRSIGRMSGGQRQCVFIARALINEPRLLLLDEPTIGIDSRGQQAFFSLLRQLQNEMKITLLMVSHNVGQLTHYVDRIACINKRLHWHDHASLLTDNVLHQVYDCELNAWHNKVQFEKNITPYQCDESNCYCHHHTEGENL